MFSFKTIARRIVERAREHHLAEVREHLAEVRARHYPEVVPIPMEDWLAQLDARIAANAAAAQPIPIPGEEDEEDEPGDGDDEARRADWEDFDRRR